MNKFREISDVEKFVEEFPDHPATGALEELLAMLEPVPDEALPVDDEDEMIELEIHIDDFNEVYESIVSHHDVEVEHLIDDLHDRLDDYNDAPLVADAIILTLSTRKDWEEEIIRQEDNKFLWKEDDITIIKSNRKEQ